jgi:hypothetical protein
MAAREMGGPSLADALVLCELLAKTDVARYERAALRWLERFIDERLPPLTEVALAASALAELRHGRRSVGGRSLEVHRPSLTGSPSSRLRCWRCRYRRSETYLMHDVETGSGTSDDDAAAVGACRPDRRFMARAVLARGSDGFLSVR